MKINLKQYLFVCLILLPIIMLSSCTFQEVEFKKIESFKLIKVENTGALVELNVSLNNPNRIAFTVHDVDMNVFINQTNIGKVNLQEKVKIPGHSSKTHRFLIKANYGDLAVGGFSSILSAVLSKKINFSCQGNIKGSSYGISKTVPVNYQGDVPLGFLGNK